MQRALVVAWALFGLGAGAAAQSFQPTPAIHAVFLITLENLRWSEVAGSPSAPYINGTLLPQAAYAEQYMAEPNLHPSLPNYLWLESGSNWGIYDDNLPPLNVQTAPHLVTALDAAGYTWGAWIENFAGGSCPLADSADGLYTPAVNPTVFFNDVTDNSNPSGTYCIAHEHPFSQLAAALAAGTVPNFNWIVPNLCDDGHSCPLETADQWLATLVPQLLSSAAYRNGGAIFITWDEVDTPYVNVPVGMIVLSASGKGGGYSNSIAYTHSSTLRTFEEIFGVTPYFGDAATSNDLSDLFNQGTFAATPAALAFAPQAVATTSAPQTVTVTNGGASAVAVQSIAISGHFTESNDCGSAVLGGATCLISVSYAPPAAGTDTGTLTLNDSAAGSRQTIALSGSTSGGSLSLKPAQLDFGTQAVNQASAPQSLQITNVGLTPLTGTVVMTPPFTQTNNCTATLAAGASCTFAVTFTPVSAATSSGTLTLTDNAPDSPQVVPLHGVGAGPLAVVSAEDLHFGNQNLGTSSTPLAVTLTNGGSGALLLSNPAIQGPFTQTDNCGTSLAAGATCTFEVTFTPATAGGAEGSLTLTDNANGSPQVVDLDGQGAGPVAQLVPAAIAFGTQPVGGVGAAEYLTLENTGNVTLTLGAVSLTGPFTQSNNCATVAGGGSCFFQLTFVPTAAGAASGVLTLNDNAKGSPQVVPLSGTGASAAVALALRPSSLSFGSVAVDKKSAAQTVTVTNTGGTSVAVGAVKISGAFTQTNGCGTLAAGASCTVAVVFAPSAKGSSQGTLSLTDKAPGSPQTVALTGTATAH